MFAEGNRKLRNMNILLLYLLFAHLLSKLYATNSVNSETVTYYENLILTETQKAFHTDLPTSAEAYRPTTNAITDYGVFDFVIVGSGSAGSVIASRLSEVGEWKILLLEAGGYETNFSDIPAEHMYLQGLRFNWNFNTTVQNSSCLGMINQRCSVPRGRALGGTSVINGLVYSRGNKLDYDGWAAEGNRGWSYEEVLPYFIKSENSQINGDPRYHGHGGYWNVEYHKPTSKQLQAFIEAYVELYGSTPVDYNGKNQLGMFHSQLNNIQGKRDSLAKAFLRPAKNRNNLKILTESYVTKVLINKNKTAYGVEFARNGKLYNVKVSKEVIISGGSINSPHILMLSGIGPEKHLKKHKIPVIQNLPVGEKLQDHPSFFGLYVQTNLTEGVVSLEEKIEQYLNDFGPLSIALNSQGVGFYQSITNTPNYPDFEFEFMPSNSTSPFLQRGLKVTTETYNALWSKVDPQRSFNVYLIVLHPKSIGTLKLKSKDPYQYPLININSLSDSEGKDIETMYQALQIFKKHLQTDAMKKINASIIYGDYPQCKTYVTGSKDYWFCAFRLLTAQLYHPIATCRMGDVVDHNLRVYGVNSLRVADASVIPFPTSGHTNSPAVMIGEKISDQIKLDYGKKIEPITNTIC